MSPVTIPALTTIVDRQFKEERTLCPVRALRYYLDRTKDLRGSRSLLFISFKKRHTSDIRPATLSSWLKQTILLCYKQADQQALDLVQVKAHDIRAFAASKAFYGEISVDQIMQACHWKAHNTFTNVYLKDLTWSDKRWQSGNTLASHLCGRGSIPIMAVSGKAGSCLPLVGSLQYRTLANYMYWFPLPFQLPVVI